MIVKCGDDLRQELLAYQLLLQFQVSTMAFMAGLFLTSRAFKMTSEQHSSNNGEN